jgi:trimeric autotransporter adhesin
MRKKFLIPFLLFAIIIIPHYAFADLSFGSSNSTSIILGPHSTTTTVTPNPATVSVTGSITFTASVTDNSNPSTTPSGIISWSDGNAGGKFDPTLCALSSGSCNAVYTPATAGSSGVIVTASYLGEITHSGSSGTSTTNLPHVTVTSISPNAIAVLPGVPGRFVVQVVDIANSQTTPAGTISWSDGGVGGTFSSSLCVLSSGTCTVSYLPPANYTNNITIAATYAGDATHNTSSNTATLKLKELHATATTITSNSYTTSQGSQVKFTVTTVDTSSPNTTPAGTISWNDGNAGGTFNPASCILSSGTCTVSYTTSSSPNLIKISAEYGGDNLHHSSLGTSQLSVIVLPSSIFLNTDQSYYAYGDVVTLSVNLPNQSLQNIAVGVSNPTGNNMISRTITTDENGTGSLQFKIPNNYKTGIYQTFVSALVYGKNYTNSTEFTVIKSHGMSIDSVQITDQQGNPASMLAKGQNGFVKVSLSSDEKMPVLLTLNLFDANQSSLGTASLKSIINPGSSQVSLSFFIPSNVQVGLANVFTDAYSDWPNNGGTPLATESCLAADLQDPTIIPTSYVPNPPHSCTNTSRATPSSNPQFTTMTNNQAQVTLGIEIQNDSMTFMSPTQAHLLALAYQNTTSKNNSVGIVNVDLNSLGTPTTKIGPDQFTTLAGPDIQNNPLAMKILQEIEASKRQVANIVGNETADKLNQQLVLKQRQTVASQLKEDLTKLAQATANTTSSAAYAKFLSTVDDGRAKPVFQSEYDFMTQRIDAANAAMQNVLNNGGSLGQAFVTFNEYATISHVQMVSLNTELNIAYGLADSRIQSCFDVNGRLTVVNGVNPCVANVENNSTGPSGISIISVQATDQLGNPVSLLQRGQTGYIKVILNSNTSTQSLVTINLFDSDVASLGTASAQYTLNAGQSEVILPYYVPAQSGTGLASVYANVFTDWPNKGGMSQSNELSYFVGIS